MSGQKCPNYQITSLNNGKFECYLQYQDGHEDWIEDTIDKATQKMIAAAWAYNHIRINSEMITYNNPCLPTEAELTQSDAAILEDVRHGHKVLLPHDDFRLVANLLPSEVDIIYGIREGRIQLVHIFDTSDGDSRHGYGR